VDWRLRGLGLCLLGAALWSAGCTGLHPPPSTVLERSAASAQRHVDDVLREATVESNALRAEMAAARIAAAKKEAEVQDLHRQLADLQQARTQQQQQIETKQQEVAALRNERDQLRQAQSEVQVQLAELPQLRQAAGEAKAVEARLDGRLKELESALSRLTMELAQVQQSVEPKPSLEQSQAAPKTKPKTPHRAERRRP